MIGLERLALNQATIKHTAFADVVSLCERAGIRYVGVWRECIAELGAAQIARQLKQAGLGASSLCRGGFLTSLVPDERAAAIASTKSAIAEASAIGSPNVVIVCGGLAAGERDLPAARHRVVDAVGELVPDALRYGVRLGIEPLHPMFCADRAVISTLAQALDLAEQFPAAAVGVVVDTYHVWWDPDVGRQISRAVDRIAAFQVSDWVLPLPADTLLGRGHLGDGSIDFRSLADMVTGTGYEGPVEAEIFNEQVWAAPPATTVATVVDRFLEHLGDRR